LPKACPTARILSFGYNSKFVSFFPVFRSKDPVAKETTIDSYSSSLLQDLSNLRERTETPKDRPIIFVAHSLGGLVVSNAVAGDKGVNKEGKSISDSTFGILFLGTPFEGSKKAEWETLGGRLKNIIPSIKTVDLKDLKDRSAKLQSINAALQIYVKDRDRRATPLYIACYFEEFPTYKNGIDMGHIVTKESASFQNADIVLPIPGNHDTMCKFAAPYVPGYERVSGQLSQWIKDLKPKAAQDSDQQVNSLSKMCCTSFC
jgi:predicted alpha/beta hydrolase family esterase